ncbi:uncharacterized protein PAC_13174 [Phialocephala subalpina]|uniref:Zn(2)-C6 fungal-type domain-containing protein n=1 Tax=Phialocephala subalpina TaxID=576137 RepID=A0A1L7XE93_9HELO|nr:uncharacterized protein PAC_13174 [Phialocephala subalpina]
MTGFQAPIVFSRAHRKSRTGCGTCKTRKVKCDEHRPVCNNCSRRCADLIACDFPPRQDIFRSRKLVPRQSDSKPNSSFTPSPHVIDLHPTGTSTSPKQRRLEMRLLHHYTTTTCHALPSRGKNDPHQIFSSVVPQIGFVSDLVLDAMLAFSALHLRSISSSSIKDNSLDLAELEAAESRYMSKALNLQRRALQHLEAIDGNEVFSAAMFIFHYVFLTENYKAVSNETEYFIPTRIYHLARGSKVLFMALPDLGYEHYDLYCPRTDLILAERPSSSWFIESALKDCERLRVFLETHTPQASPSTTKTTPEYDLQILCESLSNFTQLIHTFSAGTEHIFPQAQNLLALFPIRSGKRFEEMLDEKEPIACGLMARNFACIHAVGPGKGRGIWWLHGGIEGGTKVDIGRGNVLGIQGILKDVGRNVVDEEKWDWVMDWPIAVVEGRIEFDV